MYVRPELPRLEFDGPDGTPIRYGKRWGDDGPPDRTYSLTRHPERFAPLVDVARALIEFLERTYDVDVTVIDGLPAEPPARLREYEHGQVRVVRTTILTPRHDMCAPLLIAETSFPTVLVVPGAAGFERAPACGCDACDEDMEECATELENLVLAVVNGRYQEEYSWTDGITRTYAGDWGARTSTTSRGAASKHDIDALRLSQRERHGERWLPWPPRREDDAAGEHTDLASARPLDRLAADAPFVHAIDRIRRRLRVG